MTDRVKRNTRDEEHRRRRSLTEMLVVFVELDQSSCVRDKRVARVCDSIIHVRVRVKERMRGARRGFWGGIDRQAGGP